MNKKQLSVGQAKERAVDGASAPVVQGFK
jgi:Transposase DDE domain